MCTDLGSVLLQCWLTKIPEMPPQQIDGRMERGSYTVFDIAQWAQVAIYALMRRIQCMTVHRDVPVVRTNADSLTRVLPQKIAGNAWEAEGG